MAAFLSSSPGMEETVGKNCRVANFPATPAGEAGFAASNTNIDVYGDHAWWATGGEKSRILHSSRQREELGDYSKPQLLKEET